MLVNDDITFTLSQQRYLDAAKQATSVRGLYASTNQIAKYVTRNQRSGFRELVEPDGSPSYVRYDSNAVPKVNAVVAYSQLRTGESPGSMDSKPA